MNEMTNTLERIMATKREEVAALKSAGVEADLKARAADAPPPRGFQKALERVAETGRAAVIAEAKKASPSAGLIAETYDPAALARAYAAGGAACLSILTDRTYFQGDLDDLRAGRAACDLPILRKDFLLDPIQVLEARAAGADAILIILAAVEDDVAEDLLAAAREHGMDALVEVHETREMLRASPMGASLIGVNNRDLSNFETRLETTKNLAPLAPEDAFLVSESGIKTPDDVRALYGYGARAFLIGEALSGHAAPETRLKEFVDAPAS